MKKENNIIMALNNVIGQKIVIYVDAYIDEPVMLINRIREKRVYIITENDRLIIQAADKYKTQLVNLKIGLIQNVETKRYSDKMFEIRFELKNMSVKYKITIEQQNRLQHMRGRLKYGDFSSQIT